MTLTNTTTSIQPRVRPGMPPHSTEAKKTGDRHRAATPLRRRTALIACTRGAGRIRTGPYMRGDGTRRGGTVTWQPPSIPKAWPPGQVFALQPCGAVPIRGVCGTTGATAWRWPGRRIPAWTSGFEGATVRWYGHTDQPEPDTVPPSGAVNEPLDDGQLWGGLIAYKPSYTTPAA